LILDSITSPYLTNSETRLNTKTGAPANPTDISRGVFGATVGIDRLLNLWDKYNIKATWFTPAHSAESFPKQIRKIVEKGHEIGLHGYTHEFVSTLSEQQQRDVLEKSIQVLTDIVGKKPRGWTAPAWSTSRETISLLEEFGIVRPPTLTIILDTRLTCITGI
jgi:peptidoglycan/xylan/chitin deacetylase (PgdA/CDA1 family)